MPANIFQKHTFSDAVELWVQYMLLQKSFIFQGAGNRPEVTEISG